jgi:hypothetical protein
MITKQETGGRWINSEITIKDKKFNRWNKISIMYLLLSRKYQGHYKSTKADKENE